MSFVDTVDLESQVPYSDSPEFDQLTEKISSGLFAINSSLGTLHSHLKALGKKNSSSSIQERAVALAEDLRNKFRELSDSIKELTEWQEDDGVLSSGVGDGPVAISPAQKFTQQKLSREFSSALAEFQDLQRQLAEKQRKSIVLAKEQQHQFQIHQQENRDRAQQQHHSNQLLLEEEEVEDNSDLDENQTAVLQEEQEEQELINQHELDYQNRLIQEREAEIRGIEQGIDELNEIFTDLGALVTEQGTVIDNIEANVYNMASATRDAAGELTKAAKHQRNFRGRAACLLIILVIILTVILLAAFLG
ncbi:uncharacterized protein SAPINGB_P001023 [Magnusiomyces paraingens]|uniref:t-SNARE coiled-coil homology domain-containing protein n=1 Tax=Magnusiomyces paraingens TaxID=2606893 RepID=A0A5E8B5G4_9ASCO|nr:uncharacterized protein SAPINGB_P001023 [Saprochaete ingens]VVT46054.1 unnamed protein product [Saprochaete ingens]